MDLMLDPLCAYQVTMMAISLPLLLLTPLYLVLRLL
jgi:hypothetical protein